MKMFMLGLAMTGTWLTFTLPAAVAIGICVMAFRWITSGACA